MLSLINQIFYIYFIILVFRYVVTDQEIFFNPIGQFLHKATKFIVDFGSKQALLPAMLLVALMHILLNGAMMGGGLVSYAEALLKFLGFLYQFSVIALLLTLARNSMVGGIFIELSHRYCKIFTDVITRVAKLKGTSLVLAALLFVSIDFLICVALVDMLVGMANSGGASIESSFYLAFRFWISMIYMLLTVYTFVLILRAIISWFSPDPRNILLQLLMVFTEPLLAQIRRFVPAIGMFDVSIIVAIILVNVVARLLVSLI